MRSQIRPTPKGEQHEANDADSHLLLRTVLSDHLWRIEQSEATLQPLEVVVQLSMVAEDALEDAPDAAAIADLLPRLGRDFFTVRGTYLLMDEESLVDDTVQALQQALRRSPDGEFVPLVLSMLDRDLKATGPHGQLNGFALDLMQDRLVRCWIAEGAIRLEDAPAKLSKQLSLAVHRAIQGYWRFVASLD